MSKPHYKCDVCDLKKAKVQSFTMHDIEFHDTIVGFTFTLYTDHGDYDGSNINLVGDGDFRINMLASFHDGFGNILKNALMENLLLGAYEEDEFGDEDKDKIREGSNVCFACVQSKRIIENPTEEAVRKNLKHFNSCCKNNKLSTISIDDMRWVLIEYLRQCGPNHMDVRLVCESNWKNTAFTDTAPRDRILSMLEKSGKIVEIRGK